MDAMNLLNNSLMLASTVDSLVNNVAVKPDLGLSVSNQDLLTYKRDSLANNLDYSANNSISIRAMLIDNLDLMVNMLVMRSAIDMGTATLMDCLVNRANQYDLATIQATIQMHLMHRTVKNLDRRVSCRLL